MGKPARRSRQRYLPRGTAPDEFFAKLDAAGCRYVVLRWFEDLPRIAPGEDIDILVHDEDVQKVRSLLSKPPLASKLLGLKRPTRCDIYSVSGLSGSSYRGVAYYPPHLAIGILERAVRHRSGAMVPSPTDHFYSLAFHALYHKGLRSGLPVSDPELQPHPGPEHAYREVLHRLARDAGVAVDIEMNALDAELARAGWQPPIDFMERVLPDDRWAFSRALARQGGHAIVKGLALFVLRERALDKPEALATICDLLRSDGFNILAVTHLDEDLRKLGEREIRGGNWDKGPWPASGGRPAVAIAMLDVFPIPPGKKTLRRHPRADNQRTIASKAAIRNWANADRPTALKCNIAHGSDNAREAAAHIALLFPDSSDAIRTEAERLLAATAAPGEVVRRLDRSGRNAIVEVIRQTDGSLAVRKRFRPGKEAHLERELSALGELKRICPEVAPAVLEAGPNYFVMPYYADTRTHLRGRIELPIPVPALRKAFMAAKSFFDHGYVLGDFRPHNLIIERGHRIKIIDLEDVYERRPGEGPADFEGLEIFQPEKFDQAWGRAAGLSAHSVLHDPVWKLYLKRWSFGYLAALASALRKGHRNVMRGIDRRRQRAARREAARHVDVPQVEV